MSAVNNSPPACGRGPVNAVSRALNAASLSPPFTASDRLKGAFVCFGLCVRVFLFHCGC